MSPPSMTPTPDVLVFTVDATFAVAEIPRQFHYFPDISQTSPWPKVKIAPQSAGFI